MTPLEKSEQDLDQAIRELKGEIAERPSGGMNERSDAASSSPGSLMNIPLKVQVAIGAVEMTVGELSNLGPGQTVALNKLVGDPVDIIVNGTRIGTGFLVAIPGNTPSFGIKIHSLND
ncbi:flagellar motor switch protein FliN [Zhengella mangrovi]|uniref:Flagellar motor switch protein FliN n=1 Tax=Zhengella mangrovi TaxID=1982044 RepID=A0A2G1QJR1_9HYPH|nr:FliM/FliN family flagellar motor switch protein [Zhengella mangrovi]PHP65732.1 flagellar motor switch protein FliN [Zhengella mangrovi]